tara:strand:+ start:42476 stop:44296 length:1821 start_codon:yes stop_codon:yes gene_type:complete
MAIDKNKRVQEIDYTKTSFDEIKEQLVQYAKRNYPDTYRDFKKSSFGSLLFDMVSYVGDQLHYYLDHNANEAILPYTKNPEVAVQLIQALGAVPTLNPVGVGEVEIQVLQPANALGVAPDATYELTSRAGTKFRSQGGAIFTQMRDVTFTADTSRIVGYSTVGDGSKINYFGLKATVPVVSGEERTYTVEVGTFRRFLKIEIPDPALTEILKVEDSNKNEYHQVKHLSKKFIHRPLIDPNNTDILAPTIMKKVPVPRRFIVEKSLNKTFLVFGHGEKHLTTTKNSVAEPTKLVLNFAGKTFDPSRSLDAMSLTNSDSLGVAPQNTTLTITYRRNTVDNTNAAAGTITQVVEPLLVFKNENSLELSKVNYIKENVQVFNDNPINGNISIPNTEELKRRYTGAFGAQERAVTKEDYVSTIYTMPPVYGSIKRAAVIRDTNDLRRNLNIFLMAEGPDGKFQKPTRLLKENVKTWLDSAKMISDTLDLFDANIINFGIEFKVTLKNNTNRQTILSKIKNSLYEEFTSVPPDIGEPLYISEVIRFLQNIPEVASVPMKDGVVITSITGDNYTDYLYDVRANTSPDNNYVYIPQNSIWEVKYVDDIKGTIIG